MQKTKFGDWHTRAAVIVFDGALLLLFVNLILYVIIHARSAKLLTPWHRYGSHEMLKAYPGWREEDVRALLTETWSKLTLEYEPFTGFREKPFRGKFVNIDPVGFRFSKDQAPWPPRPEAFNVFVFGGSTTFGFGLPDDQTIPSYLGECGAPNGPESHLAVYNFGRPSYFSSQELILFQQLLDAGFVPQAAVFIDGVNDFHFAEGWPLGSDRLRDFVAGKTSNRLDAVPVIQAAHWVTGHFAKPQPRRIADPSDAAVLKVITNRWLANKRMIEVMGAAFGVRTIFVWQPMPIYKYDLSYHFSVHSDKNFGGDLRSKYGYALMEELRAKGKLGSDVLWLADMQQDKHENLYVDQWHYTASFSREIAAQICSFLREQPGDTPSSRN